MPDWDLWRDVECSSAQSDGTYNVLRVHIPPVNPLVAGNDAPLSFSIRPLVPPPGSSNKSSTCLVQTQCFIGSEIQVLRNLGFDDGQMVHSSAEIRIGPKVIKAVFGDPFGSIEEILVKEGDDLTKPDRLHPFSR